MWLSDKGCTETMEAIWASYDCLNSNTRLIRMIEKCGKELKRWSRLNFGNIKQEVAAKRRQLVEAEMGAQRIGNNCKLQELKVELIALLDKETRM